MLIQRAPVSPCDRLSLSLFIFFCTPTVLTALAVASPIRVIHVTDPSFETFAPASLVNGHTPKHAWHKLNPTFSPSTETDTEESGYKQPSLFSGSDLPGGDLVDASEIQTSDSWAKWVPSFWEDYLRRANADPKPWEKESDAQPPIPDWLKMIAPSRHGDAHNRFHPGVVVTRLRPIYGEADMIHGHATINGEDRDISKYILGTGELNAYSTMDMAGHGHGHGHTHHDGPQSDKHGQCWMGRLFRAMQSLKPFELFVICFVFGAGLGSLARIAFMLVVLARRSHEYLNDAVTDGSDPVAPRPTNETPKDEEKVALMADVDAAEMTEEDGLPVYEERPTMN